MDFTIFQQRLRSLLDVRNLSLKIAAEELGVTPATLSRYLTGDRTPDLPYLIRLCDYFDVSFDWLLGLNGEKFSTLPQEVQDIAHLYSLANQDDRLVVQAVLNKYKTKE